MSEKKKQSAEVEAKKQAAVESKTPEYLSEPDKYALELVKMKRALALANAEKALAQNEAAELNYRNLVLQLTFKYSLTENDVINEDGEILRNQKGQ